MEKIMNKNLIFFGLILSVIFAFCLTTLPETASAYYYVGWENGEYVGYFKDVSGYSNGNYGYNNNNNYNNNYNNGYNYNNNIPSNPTPYLSYMTPNSAIKNSGTTITVYGNNFVQGSIVRLNGTDLYTMYADQGTLRAQVNPSDMTSVGEYLVMVYNPAPGGGYSNTLVFTVKNQVVAQASTTSKSKTTKTVAATTNKTSTTGTSTSSSSAEAGKQVKELAASAVFGSNAFMPSSLLQWIFFFILILLGVILWRRLYVREEDKHVPLKHA